MDKLRAVRGMHDLLPQQCTQWQQAEKLLAETANSYAYQQIRTPLLEKATLFQRSVGEHSDIVAKEMYLLADRNGEQLALRPENTASVVRAALEHGLVHRSKQKLWYCGPMYRYERPQKGRYRQLHQFGVEAFGYQTAEAEAEVLGLAADIWQKCGISKKVSLQINSLGGNESRKNYRQELQNYLTKHQAELDEHSKKRITSNPLRVLDSKDPTTRQIVQQAPLINQFYSSAEQDKLNQLCSLLDALAIPYTINPLLVRGLDYYTGLVFEWVSSELGAQGTVCAGGRYDDLCQQLGGKSTPAVGFALGIERLLMLTAPAKNNAIDVYVIGLVPAAKLLPIIAQLRQAAPQLAIEFDVEDHSNISKQFKRADTSGAQLALVFGDQEINQQSAALKFLRTNKQQRYLKLAELKMFLQKWTSNKP